MWPLYTLYDKFKELRGFVNLESSKIRNRVSSPGSEDLSEGEGGVLVM